MVGLIDLKKRMEGRKDQIDGRRKEILVMAMGVCNATQEEAHGLSEGPSRLVHLWLTLQVWLLICMSHKF